ncbi:hypothetical protein BGZ63DRAFT_379225, partial [Mariannaea sp. PMI_226]
MLLQWTWTLLQLTVSLTSMLRLHHWSSHWTNAHPTRHLLLASFGSFERQYISSQVLNWVFDLLEMTGYCLL